MMPVIMRVVFFCLIILIGFLLIRYIFHPKRKLELAHQNKELFLLDQFNRVDKNLLITYKGVLFEGEKQMGTAENAFRVVHIKLWAQKTNDLHGLAQEDFVTVEKKIFEQYPYAALEWQSPVKELLIDERKSE